MAVHSVSFTLKRDSTYSERYESFMAQIRASKKVWEETTSFALVETAESASELETRLYVKSMFNHTKDLMIVIDVTGRSGVSRGKLEYPLTLGAIMPNVTQK